MDSALILALSGGASAFGALLLRAFRLDSAGPELLVACIRALGSEAWMDPAPLIGWLEHPAPAVRIAAAQALGVHGDRSALYPLRRAREQHGATALDAAAETAMALIRARLGPLEEGRLSLADGDAGGELSSAEGPGALSAPHDGTEQES